MAIYVKLERKDVEEIVRQYDITVVEYAPMAGGACNSSYKLQTRQGDYVLTIFDEKTKDDVVRLTQLLLQLAVFDIPTTRLQPTKSGIAVTMYRGKPILLKRFIRGKVCAVLDNDMLQQAGQAMAAVHQVPATDSVLDVHPYGQQTFAEIIGMDIHPLYESWLAKQHTYLMNAIPLSLPRALIHGDLFNDNILFEGQQLRAIIDFEEACCYYRLFDLGMGIVGLCTQGEGVDLYKAHAFIDGYQQSQRLEECERSALQLFVEYAATATSYWRFWKYYIHTPMIENSEKPLQMKRLAESVRAIPKAKFLTAIFN